MLRTAKKLIVVILACLCTQSALAQLQITAQTNAQALAQRLVGDGITISNVTISGSPLASGFFKNVGGTQIGLDSGIVLASGRVLTASPNWGLNGAATNLASSNLGTPGDAQLSATINGATTFDAMILEFDFVPIGDTVKFRYVFSSDEYPTFNCSSFNDAFAFFISGPGITGTKNIALVPGTNIPVAINSVNNGVGGTPSNCTNMGPGSPFTSLYVDNSTNQNFTHTGHTVVFTAVSPVVPCQTYHLKLAIADAVDGSWDSNVFLQARSLISTPLSIVNNNPTANGVPYVVEGCSSGSINITRPQKLPTAMNVNLYFGGNAGIGTDVQTLPLTVTIPAGDSVVSVPIIPIADNTVEGPETLKIYIANGNCSNTTTNFADSITIQVRDQLTGAVVVQNTSCGVATGALTVNMAPGAGTAPYRYGLNANPLQTGNVFSNLAEGNYVITVRDSIGCTFNINTTVGVNNNLSVRTGADTSICFGATFTANTTATNGVGANYNWSPSVGLSSPNAQNPVVTGQNQGTTRYIVTASLGSCTAKDTINVTTFPAPQVNAGPDIAIINGDVIQLQATAVAGTYVWTPSTGLSATNILNPMANPSATTTYRIELTTPQGCKSSDEVTITVLECINPMEAFSPNGDGINDLWMVTNTQCLRQARVQVYNRYGSPVYESNDYKNNWNGTYNGKPLPDGTYYFVITYQLINGKNQFKKGNVTILR